jgi:glycosyltransferase involved in cell wall biosynthesis
MAKNITVCIPTYEQKGLGQTFLKRTLEILKEQTYKDFDVVVSDNSTYFQRERMEKICKEYSFVKYVRCDNIGISANTNNAIRHAEGKIIKILFQDDYLYGEDSLQILADSFKGDWLVSACLHNENGVEGRPFTPKYTKDIYLGNNTISSPSVLAFKNKGHLEFDEKLSMLMDVDYYKQCYDKFGEPTILDKITVVNQVGEHQAQNHISKEKLAEELEYVKNKYV